MERAWRKEERDLELNLRGSPQARRRQVPRPPRKTTPLPFGTLMPFFSPSLLHFLPWTVSRHFCSCTSSTRSLSCLPVRVPSPAPVIVRLYFRLFASPGSLSFSIFYEHKVHGELPGRSYNPWTWKPRPASVHVCVCVYVRWLTPL